MNNDGQNESLESSIADSETDFEDDDEGGNDEREDADDRSDVAYAKLSVEEACTCQRGFGIRCSICACDSSFTVGVQRGAWC